MFETLQDCWQVILEEHLKREFRALSITKQNELFKLTSKLLVRLTISVVEKIS